MIYTGSLDVRVDAVDVAARDAQQKVAALGGYLFSQRSSSVEGAPSATLVFKLPPGSFGQAIDQLATIGKEVGRNVSADDVTAQVVDIESRLKTAQSSLERTRDLLQRASSITDIVALEREVAARETIVEQLQGQLRVFRSQVAAATLTLTIGEKLKETKPTPSKNIDGPVDGLRAGAVALANTLQVVLLVLAVLAVLAPWLVLAAVLWWIGHRIYRRLAPRIERRRAASMRAFEERRAAAARSSYTLRPPREPVTAASAPVPQPPPPGAADAVTEGTSTTPD